MPVDRRCLAFDLLCAQSQGEGFQVDLIQQPFFPSVLGTLAEKCLVEANHCVEIPDS